MFSLLPGRVLFLGNEEVDKEKRKRKESEQKTKEMKNKNNKRRKIISFSSTSWSRGLDQGGGGGGGLLADVVAGADDPGHVPRCQGDKRGEDLRCENRHHDRLRGFRGELVEEGHLGERVIVHDMEDGTSASSPFLLTPLTK